MNRVVITGIGIYSCIGKDLAEVTKVLALIRTISTETKSELFSEMIVRLSL
jgi:3-oxoacyl-(acyl-carrier-protein) synthase